ncbi:MAG: hypothetical protein IPK87_00065 [Planctomycetes bacterium]|nr:hypothetical protein [Planctomycetota bacterium]
MWRDRDGGALFRTSYAEASSEYAVLERGWVYDSGSDMTVYFDMVNGFPAFTGNWTFVPNIAKPCHMQAQGVDGNLLYFKGDTRNLADPETDRYMLLPPAGVSATTGAYAKPEDLGENDYTDRGTMWLWSGYLYVTPQVGHDVTGTTYGAQSGGNLLGSYHCWNRVYEPATGRWTAPDPAASPWWSLIIYSLGLPIAATDPSGLGQSISIGTAAAGQKSDDEANDPVQPWMEKHSDCVSRSSEDFLACVTNKYDSCIAAGGTAEECCISTIHVHGHHGSGYGGGDASMSAAERQQIADMMCPNSTVHMHHCFGDPFTSMIWPGDREGPVGGSVYLGLLDILSRIKTGEQQYIGFKGIKWYRRGIPTPYIHPHDSRGHFVRYRVNPGDGLDDIKDRTGNGPFGHNLGPGPATPFTGPEIQRRLRKKLGLPPLRPVNTETPEDYDPTQDPEYGSPTPPSE